MNLPDYSLRPERRSEQVEAQKGFKRPSLSPRPSDFFRHRNSGEMCIDVLPRSLNASFDLSESISINGSKTARNSVLQPATPELKKTEHTTTTTPNRTERSSFFAQNTKNKVKDVVPVIIDNNQKQGCNCKKTKCLKLYCDCFSNGGVCMPSCKCENCHNTVELQDLRELIIHETIEKNPLAFKSKYKDTIEKDKTLHSRGCKCSKTGCQKNYCECFRGGIGCSKLCSCKNCNNNKIELKDEEVGLYHEKVLRKRKKPNYIYEFYFNKYSELKNKLFKSK